MLLLPGTGVPDVCEPPCAGKGTQDLLQDQPVFLSTQISLQALLTEFLIKKKIRGSVKSSKIASRVISWDSSRDRGNLSTIHPKGGNIKSSFITTPLEKHLLACVYKEKGERKKG